MKAQMVESGEIPTFILMGGGFGTNMHLQQEINARFAEEVSLGMRLVIPEDP